jgi:hypothetical protein
LELALAQRFFPIYSLSVDHGGHYLRDIWWWYGSGYFDNAPQSYQPIVPFRVTRYNSGLAGPGQCSEPYSCLLIQYGLAYEQDAGNCGIGEHTGDVELLSVLIAREDWNGTNVTDWSTAQTSASYWGWYGYSYNVHGDRFYTIGNGNWNAGGGDCSAGWSGQAYGSPYHSGGMEDPQGVIFFSANQKHSTWPNVNDCNSDCTAFCCESCFYPWASYVPGNTSYTANTGVDVKGNTLKYLKNMGEGPYLGQTVDSQLFRMPNNDKNCSNYPYEPPSSDNWNGYSFWNSGLVFDGCQGCCENSEVWANKFNDLRAGFFSSWSFTWPDALSRCLANVPPPPYFPSCGLQLTRGAHCAPSCSGQTCGSPDGCCGTCQYGSGCIPPVCGDGACNGTENCANCARDCGVCTSSCSGTSGQWAGCRGTGCNVCSELVAGYELYFINHPGCLTNPNCGGAYYTCNASCPAPMSADICNGTSGQWAGCRGSGCNVCAEKVSGYSRYFKNHPACISNSNCQGAYYTCNANCPAPTSADL